MSRLMLLVGATLAITAASLPGVTPAWGQAAGLPELSEESQLCIDCHNDHHPGIYQQWRSSKHQLHNVGCYECHQAKEGEPDAYEHFDSWISNIVSPLDCGKCHEKEVKEFAGSRHAKAAATRGSLDHFLAHMVEGNQDMHTMSFPEGLSAIAVTGCNQCHGSEVKVRGDGRLDPATYPNSGVGRINPDGSEGACNACHTRHSFSVAQARHPDTCGKCHLGSEHPQKEIYAESKHGINFFSKVDQMNLDSERWVVGEDYWAAPTCATCHMSATPTQPVSHNIGARISWNNRPEVSVRPEVADAALDLPGKDDPWTDRRRRMVDVCQNCHSSHWIDAFYKQYDSTVELYNEKFGKPGKKLMELAGPVRKHQTPFANPVDWTWFRIWHHAGRRARHGASMMAPDFAQWRGMFEVAERFYGKLIPELETLIAEGLASESPERVEAAKKLQAELKSLLDSKNHRWVLDGQEEEKKAEFKKEHEKFRKRYVY